MNAVLTPSRRSLLSSACWSAPAVTRAVHSPSVVSDGVGHRAAEEKIKLIRQR